MAAGLFLNFYFFHLFLLSVASALAIVTGIYLHMCTKQGLKLFFKHLQVYFDLSQETVGSELGVMVPGSGTECLSKRLRSGGRREACSGVLPCSWRFQACDKRC